MKTIIYDIYEIDSLGFIKNINTGKMLNPHFNKKKNILECGLYYNRKTIVVSLAALVYKTFNGDYDTKKYKIVYNDKNVHNISLENLSIIERSYRAGERLINLTVDEINFFESKNPYDLIDRFINRHRKKIYFNCVFDQDDFRQHLVYELYKKTRLYFDKYRDQDYIFFAFSQLYNIIKFKMKKIYATLRQVINVEFDLINYDDESIFISLHEAKILNYGGFSYDD